MAEITGRDRVRACMKRTHADRIPVGVIWGSFRARVLGCPLKDYWQDWRKLVEGTVRCYELCPTDTVSLSWDIHMEAEAAGSQLEFPDESVPGVKRYLLSQKAALGSLNPTQIQNSGRFPAYVEACRAISHSLKDGALSGTVTGPWTTAAGLRGTEELIFDTLDDPGFVHELMKFTTEITKILGSRVLETGISLSLGEAASSCSLISPAIYRRFIKPYHQEIVRFFREKKVGLSLHVCGYIDPIMEDLVELGIVALSLDSPSSLGRMVEISQKRIALIGNVATSLFARGTEGEIESAVRDCIRVAAPGGAYILSSGCELPYNATMDRAQFFIQAAQEYGKAERVLGLGG
jgi:uroporphyrinogen decarboxylase